MRYVSCLNTSTIRPGSMTTKIRAAAQAGFQALEPWNRDVDDYLRYGRTIESLRNLLAEHNMPLVSMIAVMGFIGCEAAERPAQLAEARRRMEQAAALGSPFIVASPPAGQTDIQRCGDDYAELMALGREIGVRPAMEFLGFVEQINSIRAARAIMESSGGADATIVLDWFHMVRGDGRDTMLDDLAALRPEQIAIVHLDDVPYNKPWSEMGDHDRVYPGEGDIPLAELFRVLASIGYRGPVSLELFNRSLWDGDPFRTAAEGYRKSLPWFQG